MVGRVEVLFIAIFFAWFLGIFSLVFASNEVDPILGCMKILEQFGATYSGKILSPLEKTSISILFQQPGFSQTEQIAMAAEIFKQAQIKSFPKKIRDLPVVLRDDLHSIEGNVRAFKSNFVPLQIRLFLPSSMHQSSLRYAIEAHERAETHQLLQLSPFWVEKAQEKLPEFPREVVAREKNAMAAEWEFLHAIPRSIREAEVKQLQSIPSLEKELVDRAQIILLSADLSLPEYLKANHKGHRYSNEAAVNSFKDTDPTLNAMRDIMRSLGVDPDSKDKKIP